MVREYAETYYVPAARRFRYLAENDHARARALVEWKRKVRNHWRDVQIEHIETSNGADKTRVGEPIPVTARVRLGSVLTPGDVAVQLYTGPVDASRNLIGAANILPLEPQSANGASGNSGDGGVHTFTGALPSGHSGQHGFTVRVVPAHPDAVLPEELPLITWE
jgi:starch phosphorylase